jgi:hypothetical protein
MRERKKFFKGARVTIAAVVAVVFAASADAQRAGEPIATPPEAAAAPEATQANGADSLPDRAGTGNSEADALTNEKAELAVLEEVDEAELPEGLTPLASYVVADEITVRGLRPGDIRKRLWDLDTEIETTTVEFFRKLNEVIVDPQYHVRCVRAPRRSPAPGFNSRIMERYCYAGFQVDELETMTATEAGGGAYEPNQNWLLRKEQEYAEIVMAAIAEIPSLAVAAEDLVRMQEERLALTGGEPALSSAQYERQQRRQRLLAQFERLDQRRARKAERETEREAEREAERTARRSAAAD